MDIIISIIKLLGGIALLIYGMKMLSSNLKKFSGGTLEKFLISVTDNKFKGLLTGILITVATQSSAATTVIVVGLVNAEILTLKNAIPIIMGANIGTTITSQILRLTNLDSSSWLSLFTPATLAPIFILVGLIIREISKEKKHKTIGEMIIGVGLLFTGMITMVNIANSFSELPILSTMLSKLSNPILGVLAGAFITLVVQSSAATVGILQAISTTGITTYSSAIPIILGQNIGTCGTSIISSIGGSKNAKRAAGVHLYFNLIGTILFLIVIYTYQHFIGFSFWENSISMGGIANFHTIFNVISTIVLFPFSNLIEKLTIITINDKNVHDDDDDDDSYLSVLNMLDERVANIPNLAIINSTNVIQKMAVMCEKNFRKSMTLLNKYDTQKLEKIQSREDSIDKLDKEVASFLVKLWKQDLSDQESITITALLKIESDYEKLGDYAYKFSKIIDNMHEQNIQFSDEGYKDLEKIYNVTEESIIITQKIFEEKDLNSTVEIEALKELAELQKEKYKNKHIQRLKDGICNVDSGIAFLELINICEKLIYYCSNISVATLNYMTDKNFITEQEFRRDLYKTKGNILKNKLNEYSHKYEI